LPRSIWGPCRQPAPSFLNERLTSSCFWPPCAPSFHLSRPVRHPLLRAMFFFPRFPLPVPGPQKGTTPPFPRPPSGVKKGLGREPALFHQFLLPLSKNRQKTSLKVPPPPPSLPSLMGKEEKGWTGGERPIPSPFPPLTFRWAERAGLSAQSSYTPFLSPRHASLPSRRCSKNDRRNGPAAAPPFPPFFFFAAPPAVVILISFLQFFLKAMHKVDSRGSSFPAFPPPFFPEKTFFQWVSREDFGGAGLFLPSLLSR